MTLSSRRMWWHKDGGFICEPCLRERTLNDKQVAHLGWRQKLTPTSYPSHRCLYCGKPFTVDLTLPNQGG